MADEQEEPKIPPGCIMLRLDNAKQICDLGFNKEDFRTWDMILGVLEMAKLTATQMRALVMMDAVNRQQAMQQQVMRQNGLAVNNILKGR